jgi:exodeoxyribonuclease VII large subunit
LIKNIVQIRSQQLLWLLKQLKHPGRRLQEHAQTLDLLEGRLLRATKLRLYTASKDAESLNRRLRNQSPAVMIEQQGHKLETALHRLQRALKQRLSHQQTQLAQLARSLESESPLSTLNRGYSISFDSRRLVVRSVNAINVGDTLTTQLVDGKLESQITALHLTRNISQQSKQE